MQALVLASSSRYRADLLRRLGIAFCTADPATDETSLPGETPEAKASRLALAKAANTRSRFPSAIIIGSDQVASFDGTVLGKPGTVGRACEQLAAMRGRTVTFYTAVCVINGKDNRQLQALDQTRATMRQLTDSEVSRYVHAEQALDCAGSFKVEGLGISLFERVETSDPTALIGLPLIAVAATLRTFGLAVP